MQNIKTHQWWEKKLATVRCKKWLGWSDRDVSHDLVAHSREQGPLEWLSVKVCNHLVRGAVLDRDYSASEEVSEPEVPDLYVTGLLCCRTSSLDQFNRALVVLIYNKGGHDNALVCKEVPCPEALLESLGYSHKLCLAWGGSVVLYCTYSTYVPYSLSPYRVLNSDTASALSLCFRGTSLSFLSLVSYPLAC